MIISHEIPLQLLETSKSFNDYDFVLPTYWFKSQQYKEFYQKSTKLKIGDCGLFEGDSFSNNELIEFIKESNLDYFIIPDVWNDATQCLRNAKYWLNTIKPQLPKQTKLMAVIQCTDLNIGSTLYQQYLDLGVEAIAFNHSSEAYPKIFPHKNISISKTFGRIFFINLLLEKGIIKENIWHHLLGTNSVNEFYSYKDPAYSFIKSMDSSNPIIYGCKKQKYNLTNTWNKPKEKVEVWFDNKLDQEQLECINYNIKQFKEIINVY